MPPPRIAKRGFQLIPIDDQPGHGRDEDDHPGDDPENGVRQQSRRHSPKAPRHREQQRSELGKGNRPLLHDQAGNQGKAEPELCEQERKPPGGAEQLPEQVQERTQAPFRPPANGHERAFQLEDDAACLFEQVHKFLDRIEQPEDAELGKPHDDIPRPADDSQPGKGQHRVPKLARDVREGVDEPQHLAHEAVENLDRIVHGREELLPPCRRHRVERGVQLVEGVDHLPGHSLRLPHALDVFQRLDVVGQPARVLNEQLEHRYGLIRSERLLDEVGVGEDVERPVFLLELVEDLQNGKHPALPVSELQPELLLGLPHARKERLVLRPGLRAAHGGLQLAEDGHLLLKLDPRARRVGAKRRERRRHFRAAGLENLDGVGGLPGHVLNPRGLALRVGLLLENAVHGPGVVGHGGRVRFRGLGQHV